MDIKMLKLEKGDRTGFIGFVVLMSESPFRERRKKRRKTDIGDDDE